MSLHFWRAGAAAGAIALWMAGAQPAVHGQASGQATTTAVHNHPWGGS